MKILLLEDDMFQRRKMIEALMEAGVSRENIADVETIDMAYNAFTRDPEIKLFVSDFRLSCGQFGNEAIMRMKEIEPNLTCILMDEQHPVQGDLIAQKAGATFLQKKPEAGWYESFAKHVCKLLEKQ